MLWHQSGVNRKGEAFVQLILEGKPIAQMTPAEARDHARAVTEAAEAAEQDAFMLEFAKSTIGTTEVGAAQLLVEFRRFREARGKSGPPSDPAEFVTQSEWTRPADGEGIAPLRRRDGTALDGDSHRGTNGLGSTGK